MPTPRARALVTVGLVLLLFLASEGIARLAYRDVPDPAPAHPLLGRVHLPNGSARKRSWDDPSKTFDFRTNALGIRGSSIQEAKKPEGTYRILFVGASSLENPCTPEERSFPGVVERLLNERFSGHPRVEVGNCGISGNTAAHTLAWVEHRVLALSPDLVIDLDGNDGFDALRDDWDETGFASLKPRPPRFVEWLTSASRLAWVASQAVAGAELDPRDRARRQIKKRRSLPARDPPDEVLFRGVAHLERMLHRAALLCEDARVPFVFETVPWLYKAKQPADEDDAIWMTLPPGSSWNLTTGALERLVNAENDAIRKLAEKHGELLADLDRAVPHDRAHLLDDVHLTEKGNEAAARAIVAAIVRDGALPRPR